MRVYEKPFDITRAAFDRAMVELGFVLQTGKNSFGAPYIRYESSDHGTWFALKSTSPMQLVADADMLVAERTIVDRGITDRDALYNLLLSNEAPQEQAA